MLLPTPLFPIPPPIRWAGPGCRATACVGVSLKADISLARLCDYVTWLACAIPSPHHHRVGSLCSSSLLTIHIPLHQCGADADRRRPPPRATLHPKCDLEKVGHPYPWIRCAFARASRAASAARSVATGKFSADKALQLAQVWWASVDARYPDRQFLKAASVEAPVDPKKAVDPQGRLDSIDIGDLGP